MDTENKETVKKSVIMMLDRILGYAFFCPECHCFVCGGESAEPNCHNCGQPLNWNKAVKAPSGFIGYIK